MFLADLGNESSLESLIVCLLIVGGVAAAIYLICGRGFKQAWAPLVAAVVFAVGAVLCLLAHI